MKRKVRMVGEVKSAPEATKIAQEYIAKHKLIARPLKAIREKDTWFVDLDVGVLSVVKAKIQVNAKTGKITEYDIPS
jgi:hypothetical protein